MNKAEAYPCIGVMGGGIAGLFVVIAISDYISYFPYSPGDIDWGIYGLCGFIGMIIGAIMGATLLTGWERVAGFFGGLWGGCALGAILGLIIAAIAPVVLGIVLGAIAGVMVGIAIGKLDKDSDLLFLTIGAVIGAILSSIGWGLENEFLVNIIFIPIFASIGYVTGKSIGERFAKIEIFKAKVEQWEREGYDVSELEEMLK